MQREVRRLAAALAMWFSVSASLAESPPAKARVAHIIGLNPISAALCGRGEGFRANLANALDQFDSVALPPIWQKVKVEKLQAWFEAPPCPEASEPESNLYRSRRRVLDDLGRRIERAKVTERVGSALARFRGWRPGTEEWPSSAECAGCGALRASAGRVADIAGRWPARSSSQLGDLLVDASMRESLVAELCAAKPPTNTGAEIEKGFRYYSWTASGARLLEIAALFERPEVLAGCRDR